MTTALGQARWASRGIALAALGVGAGGRNTAITLGALAIGMPHGAADTELLALAARGSRTRQIALITGYAGAATAATVAIRRGGSRMSQAVLAASALHFAEGELATWATPAPNKTLRAAAAAFSTVLLPAAITTVNRRTGGKPRSGLRLLKNPSPALLGTTAAAAGLTAALLARGDREAGLDTALLGAVALVPPPAVAFATYFGGWHSLRHTARVIEALTSRGAMAPGTTLARGTAQLTKRSAWAAGVGIAAAAALVAIDPDHASDKAFAAVLGLTVPHMITVAIALNRR